MAQRAPRLSAAAQKKKEYDELLASIDPSILEIPEISRSLVGDTTYLDLGKPPLHDLVKIFEDLAKKALEQGFEKVLDALAGRPLRVATVCSGTESPLLALEMIQQVLPEGLRFRFSHLFSCEIVPFKQAYIERTFGPRIIFRDITELGGNGARTAYGSLVEIPGELDLMIAGTACVDFSTLNSRQMELEEGGESGRTFVALTDYAKKNRPRIVIMENVSSAPWDDFAEEWSKIEYDAWHVSVDSKNYYVPQTRNRGYMVCIDKKRLPNDAVNQSFGNAWVDLVKSMERKASSPTGAFILSDDDPRLELSRRSAQTDPKIRSWDKYQERHRMYRDENKLGVQRPISKSRPGGTASMPPDFYGPWLKTETERVKETLDIKYLLNMSMGTDMNYKERLYDVSQGVDRIPESEKNFGVAGCLTPKGMPFITTRGSRLSGYESLALQGLPTDRMMFTTETLSDLQDLAGNAMTSTVVCAVMLAALITFQDVLKAVPKCKKEVVIEPTESFALKDDEQLLPITRSQKSGLLGPSALIADASRAVRYCQCEYQSASKKDLVKCKDCGHTACTSCKGNPMHRYEGLKLKVDRINPSDFKRTLKEGLPMSLELEGLSVEAFEQYNKLFTDDVVKVPSSCTFEEFSRIVRVALTDKARYFDILRGENWTVMYEGENSSLRLSITEKEIWWFMYGKPPSDSPARCLLREILKKPIARMAVTGDSLLKGQWEVCAPISTGFCLSISGFGDEVKSWEAECGLLGDDVVDSKVWKQIRVRAENKEVSSLNIDVCGDYKFLPNCGTALGSLYKKEATTSSPDVYLFLDPSKYGEAHLDSCVFSFEHNRLNGHTPRMTIAELSPSWRAVQVTSTQSSVTAFTRAWQKVTNASLKQSVNTHMEERSRPPDLDVSADNESECSRSFITFASLSAPATMLNPSQEASSLQALRHHIPTALKSLSWAIEGLAAASGSPDWKKIDWNIRMSPGQATICNGCVPIPPGIIWSRSQKDQVVPLENPKGAATFERAVKERPPAFMVFSQVHAGGIGELRFAINLQSMAHKAFGKLIGPRIPENSKDAFFHWRLLSNVVELARKTCRRMVIGDNNDDSCSAQPMLLLRPLRLNQLRSLTWMVAQESDDIKPFVEEETEEAVVSSMSWRAEVRAFMPKIVRGGVLADDVGYGKTAIVLGLLAVRHQQDLELQKSRFQTAGFFTTGATLIVVPLHLMGQWKDEIDKFLGTGFVVRLIKTTKCLDKLKPPDLMNAHIVLVAWDMLKTQDYYDRLRSFTGSPQVPEHNSGERIFDNWFAKAERSLRELVPVLQGNSDQGSPGLFKEAALAHFKQVLRNQADSTYRPSKRVKGKVEETANVIDNIRDDVGPDLAGDGTLDVKVGSAKGIKRKRGDEESEVHLSDDQKLKQATARMQEYFNTDSGDVTKMQGLPIHAFSFARLVIDEYTYTKEVKQCSLISLRARSKWVLSGTPATDEFADVKSIARYLGIHLGIDDDGNSPTKNARLNQARRCVSGLEAMQMFQVPPSQEWYEHRRDHAQVFLDTFARKNPAEINDIAVKTHAILCKQLPMDRIMYDSLSRQLELDEGQLCPTGNPENNPEAEVLNEFLSEKGHNTYHSAHSALLKCATVSDLSGSPWNVEKCRKFVDAQQKTLNKAWEKLTFLIKQTILAKCLWAIDSRVWSDFSNDLAVSQLGDPEVEVEARRRVAETSLSEADFTETSDVMKKVVERFDKVPEIKALRDDATAAAENPAPDIDNDDTAPSKGPAKDAEEATSQRKKGKNFKKSRTKEAKLSLLVADNDSIITGGAREEAVAKELHDDMTTTLRNICKTTQLIRFCKAIVSLQASPEHCCDCCGGSFASITDVAILKDCGHTICKTCVETSGEEEQTTIEGPTVDQQTCPVDGCKESAGPLKCIPAFQFQGKNLIGRKLTRMINIMEDIPSDDQVLLFIQSSHLRDKAVGAMKTANIDFVLANNEGNVKKFRAPDQLLGEQVSARAKPRSKVLVLELGAVQASGLNLQCANHVIFLSPYNAPSWHDYQASMTQAIGRSLRYGQEKTVHIYHMLSMNTADVTIFQARNKGSIISRDGKAIIVDKSHLGQLPRSFQLLEGPSLEFGTGDDGLSDAPAQPAAAASNRDVEVLNFDEEMEQGDLIDL